MREASGQKGRAEMVEEKYTKEKELLKSTEKMLDKEKADYTKLELEYKKLSDEFSKYKFKMEKTEEKIERYETKMKTMIKEKVAVFIAEKDEAVKAREAQKPEYFLC